jgi:NADPH:quinone reductase-like Zn-dependent oxidoreductase
MKAAVRSKYGSPEVLSINEIDIPTPNNKEVLIRVYATTVSRTDYHILRGRPFIMRFFTGLFKPRLSVTGTDFAGRVEAVGKNVMTFKAGDKVMGFDFLGLRSHANYLTVSEAKVGIAPNNITYEQVAACVEGAIMRLTLLTN